MHPRFQLSSFWGATLISPRVGLAFAGIQPALALLDTAEQVENGQNMPKLFLNLLKSELLEHLQASGKFNRRAN